MDLLTESICNFRKGRGFGGILFSDVNRTLCKQIVETLARRRGSASSGLVLHCLPMSHKINLNKLAVSPCSR